MSAVARKLGTGRRSVVGDRLVNRNEVDVYSVKCSCDWEQREEVALDTPLVSQLRDMSCNRCGRLGQMRVVLP